MKPLTTALAASALLALTACGGDTDADENSANEAAAENAGATTGNEVAEDVKPVTENATATGDEAAPAGDKPAADGATDLGEAPADGAPPADKPTE